QHVDAGVRSPLGLAAVVVVRDLEVAPCEDLADVDLAAADRRLAAALPRLAGPQERLGRDARPVRALAAQQLALDDGHAHAGLGQRPRTVLAGGAAAEDDDVVLTHDPARALASSTCAAATISPMCEKACGKLPSTSP